MLLPCDDILQPGQTRKLEPFAKICQRSTKVFRDYGLIPLSNSFQYSRPPENLTSPNRESNSAILQELVNLSPNGKSAALQQDRNHHNRQPGKRTGSGSDLFQNSSRKSGSGSRSGNGPLAILRRSFRRSTNKKHQITSYQVSATNPPTTFTPAFTTPSSTTSAATTSPSFTSGSQERVSRKFSNPHPPSSVTAPSPKLLPGRASSPATLTKQPQVHPHLEESGYISSNAMKSLVMPEEHPSLHSTSAVARASEVLVRHRLFIALHLQMLHCIYLQQI